MKALSVLGSTGSIGTQTLELAEEFPDRFRVVALTAGNNLDLLVSQIQRHAPEAVWEFFSQFEGLGADRAGGTEHGEGFHGGSSSESQSPIDPARCPAVIPAALTS